MGHGPILWLIFSGFGLYMGCLNIKGPGESEFKNSKLNQSKFFLVTEVPVFDPFFAHNQEGPWLSLARASKYLRFRLRIEEEAISGHVDPRKKALLTYQKKKKKKGFV